MTRERCKCCHRYSPLGFHIPDDIWEAVTADTDFNVLCIMCLDRLATERGIAWEAKGVQFHPVSLATLALARD
jgi:hypothetical protein